MSYLLLLLPQLRGVTCILADNYVVYFAREAAVAGFSRDMTDSMLSMAVCNSSMDAAYEIRMHPPLPKASPGTNATCKVTISLGLS